MNKVKKRSKIEHNAKFYYASQRMTFESKAIKLTAYGISIIPILLSLIPISSGKTSLIFIATMVSFSLTVLLEFISSFLNNHKEKSVLLKQIYDAQVTGLDFSKIYYDREMTNDLNELAIRKSAVKMAELNGDYYSPEVPEEIGDKYSYLYLCRLNSASTNYLMSRMYSVYIFCLAFAVFLFVCFAFVKNDTFQFLQLIIQFYPLILPIIRNISSCQKTMKKCTKLSADIDNFFAEGDSSNETLAKFVYYTQNIQFEALMASPAKYTVFSKIFKNGLENLERGVTKRFITSTYQLSKKNLSPKPKTQTKDLLTSKATQLKTSEKKPQQEKLKVEDAKKVGAKQPADKKSISSAGKTANTKKTSANKSDTQKVERVNKENTKKTSEKSTSPTKKSTKTQKVFLKSDTKKTANQKDKKQTNESKTKK